MAVRIILVATLLVIVTAFHQDPPLQQKTSTAPALALPAASNLQLSSALPPMTEDIDPPVAQSCFAFMLRRPLSQRADAVQARLRHADRMTSAFDPNLLTVDVVGDHANILSLEFPVVWPDNPDHISRVSSVVDGYFSSQNIKDYLCESGFAEVRLSARGTNDEESHLIWKAQVTTAGLLKDGPHSRIVPDPLSLSTASKTPMVLHK